MVEGSKASLAHFAVGFISIQDSGRPNELRPAQSCQCKLDTGRELDVFTGCDGGQFVMNGFLKHSR